MRYCRVRDQQGEQHLGVYDEKNRLYYLDELFPELKGRTLIDFIRMVDGDTEQARDLVHKKAAAGTAHSIEGRDFESSPRSSTPFTTSSA